MRTVVGNLELLRVAVDRANSLLDSSATRLQSVQRTLNLPSQAPHLIHVCEEHFHLSALLSECSFTWRDHSACRGEPAEAPARPK